MEIGMYIITPEPVWAVYFINPSIDLYVYM
jgi:hypothetical protein